ncbi:MAG: hypothetical protein IT337_17895 [Thermomicrobiales bacterium]|nr:hypothetical protein [Thermomicrobiales bacterium]
MQSPIRFFSRCFPGALAPIAAVAVALAAAAVDAAPPAPALAPSAAPAAIGVPVAVAGEFLGVVDGALAVQEIGGDAPVAFPLIGRVEITRGGETAGLDALLGGDQLRMTIDGTTGGVLRVDAEPAAAPMFAPSGEMALLAALGLIGGGVLLVARNRRPAVAAPLTAPVPVSEPHDLQQAAAQREIVRPSFERPARAS